MSFLLDQTRQFDKVAFDNEEYAVLDRRHQKIRHIGHHIAKAHLKILSLGPRDTDTRAIIVGDLGLYRSQLMYEFGLEAIQRSLDSLPNRVEAASRNLTLASGKLATYIERCEKGVVPDGDLVASITEGVIPRLHAAHLTLAEAWEIDPNAAQLARMERPNLGLTFPLEQV